MKALPASGRPGKPASAQANAIRIGIGRQLVFGGVAAVGLIVVLGGMAATIDFAGAVVASGRLVVSSTVKKIQHQTGGTVTEIRVRDGDRVKAGDLLVQLDPTLAAANLGIVTKGLAEAMAQKARLEAERAGLAGIRFPARWPEGPAQEEDRGARAAAHRRQGAGRRGPAPGRPDP